MAIRDIKSNDVVEGCFVVKFKKPVQDYSNGYRFELRLADKTGEVMLKFWGPRDREKVDALYDSIGKDDVVFVRGLAKEYRENVEVSVNAFEGLRLCGEDEYDRSEFVDSLGREEIDSLYAEFRKYLSMVSDSDLKKILSAFFDDPKFVSDFQSASAAIYRHHARIGGLLQHTLAVTALCDHLCRNYEGLDRDMVLAGAMLHDIGKVREFEITNNIHTSVEGMLVGHVVIGVELLHKRVSNLSVSEEKVVKLKHIILSHHGELEYGSPKTPAFPEAFLVHLADNLDSSLTRMIDQKETARTEDDYIYTKDFGNLYLK